MHFRPLIQKYEPTVFILLFLLFTRIPQKHKLQTVLFSTLKLATKRVKIINIFYLSQNLFYCDFMDFIYVILF